MAIIGTGFKVVTEFVFTADKAIQGAEKLNDSVKKLSDSAEQAVQSVSSLGIRYVAAFSGATGGILGVLGNAIQASDKFRASQIELANFMVANRAAFMGGAIGFKDALEQSSFIMEKIVSKARGLGISPDALVSQTKAADAFLRPKGLSGDNLSNSIELARVSLKAAPALGVSSGQAQAGIQAGISGELSKNTQFGTRLFLEAGEAIKKATGGTVSDLKSFNKAAASVRLKALVAGLDKLAGTTDIVAARADTLGSRLAQLKDLFYGVGSILKPLGDVLLPFIKETLDVLVTYLKNEGAEVVKQAAIFIKGFMASPKEMLVNLKQMSKLSGDLGTAISIGEIALFVAHFKELTHFFKGMELTKGIGNFLGGIGSLVNKIPFMKKLGDSFQAMFSLNLSGGFLKSLMSIGGVMLRMAGFIGVLLIPLQGLSRAIERIKVENMFDLAKAGPQIGEFINRMKTYLMALISPLQDMIEGWANLFYELIRLLPFMGRGNDGLVGVMGWLADATEGVTTKILALWGAFKGIIAGISAILGTIAGKDTWQMLKGLSTKEMGNAFNSAFDEEFTKTMDRMRNPTLGPEGTQGKVGDSIINQKITMNNSFKEVLQPDRIAFTIADQLRKESANKRSNRPTTSAGRQAGAMD